LFIATAADDALHTVELEGIFVQIGLVPNTEWLQGAVAMTNRGEIEIDPHLATSVPGVFAAGDVATVPFKQIVIAMGEGSRPRFRPSTTLSGIDHAACKAAPKPGTLPPSRCCPLAV